jgi:hypothetical protein
MDWHGVWERSTLDPEFNIGRMLCLLHFIVLWPKRLLDRNIPREICTMLPMNVFSSCGNPAPNQGCLFPAEI